MSSNYIVAWLIEYDKWIVKYGYSGNPAPYHRIEDAKTMLSKNGYSPLDGHVAFFPATENYERFMHRQMAACRVHGMENTSGGISRETYCLCSSQLEQLFIEVNQPVPVCVTTRTAEGRWRMHQAKLEAQARAKEHARRAREREIREAQVARESKAMLWSKVKRWFLSLHARLSETPRCWLQIPQESASSATERVQVMSHYVGRDCDCGRQLWFDTRFTILRTQHCPDCRTLVERPAVSLARLRMAA